MDRRSVIRAFTAAASVALVGLALGSCSNPIDIVAAVTSEVKAANNKFLVIAEMGPFAQNAQDVSPGTTVWVKFDRDLDPASIGAQSVVFDPAVSLDKKEYNSTTRTLTITPASLEALASYTVTISGLKGADGSELQATYSVSFKTKQAPSGKMTINTGGAYTQNPNVTLNFTYNFATYKMRWSTNYADLTADYTVGISWQFASSTVLNYALGSDGAKTVYYQLIDNLNNVTPGYDGASTYPLSASVVVDTQPPVVPVGGFLIENGATHAASLAVTLYNNVTDATSPIEMRIYNATQTPPTTWEPYTATKAWTLRAAGTRVVYAEFRDKAGNAIAAPVSDAIVAGAPTMYTYMNYHVYAPLGTAGVWWSVTAPDAGLAADTYYVSYRTHSPVGSWVPAQNTGTIPTSIAPLAVTIPSENLYDIAVQIGNASAGAYDAVAAPYGTAVTNFSANVVVVYNDRDKIDATVTAPTIKAVLKNTNGWMTTYGANGVLPSWTVALVPESFVSTTTKYSTYNRVYGYPIIVTPGVANWGSIGWVWNLVTPGKGVVAMGAGGAQMLDTINANFKLYATKADTYQPNQIGMAFSRPFDGSDGPIARILGNTVWASPLYYKTVIDYQKILTGKMPLFTKVSAYLPKDTVPNGGWVYLLEAANNDYANIVQQGRFLQYGYNGLAGSEYPYPYYMYPLWVNLVYRMSAVNYP